MFNSDRKRPRDDNYDTSSTHSSDVPVSTADKKNLTVSVRETITEDNKIDMQLLISNARPETALGKTQGDHVTAYQCLLEMLMIAVRGSHLRLCSKIIADVAKAILPDSYQIFDKELVKLEAELLKVPNVKQRREFVANETDPQRAKILKNGLKKARRSIFREAVEKIGEKFIQIVNLDDNTAFPRHGPFDKTQGSRVKKAIHVLKIVNEILTVNNFNEKTQKKFYNTYLAKKAPYKDGANLISDPKTIADLEKNWHQYSLEHKKYRCKALIQSEQNTINSSTKQNIIEQFCDLFDFSFQNNGVTVKNHQSINKDKLSDILYLVVAKHIVIMFRAFPSLMRLEGSIKNDIIQTFLSKCVMDQQQWSQHKVRGSQGKVALTLDKLKEEVEALMNMEEYRLLSRDEIQEREINNSRINRQVKQRR